MTNSHIATGTSVNVQDDLRERCLPLLSLLLRPGALLIAPESAEDPVAVVVSGRDAAAQSLGAFAATDLEIAAAQQWIAPAGDGWGWKITRTGVAVIRVARAREASVRAAATVGSAATRPPSRRPAETSAHDGARCRRLARLAAQPSRQGRTAAHQRRAVGGGRASRRRSVARAHDAARHVGVDRCPGRR